MQQKKHNIMDCQLYKILNTNLYKTIFVKPKCPRKKKYIFKTANTAIFKFRKTSTVRQNVLYICIILLTTSFTTFKNHENTFY